MNGQLVNEKIEKPRAITNGILQTLILKLYVTSSLAKHTDLNDKYNCSSILDYYLHTALWAYKKLFKSSKKDEQDLEMLNFYIAWSSYYIARLFLLNLLPNEVEFSLNINHTLRSFQFLREIVQGTCYIKFIQIFSDKTNKAAVSMSNTDIQQML